MAHLPTYAFSGSQKTSKTPTEMKEKWYEQYGSLADIGTAPHTARFTPKANIWLTGCDIRSGPKSDIA
jgi:hypothetical protein